MTHLFRLRLLGTIQVEQNGGLLQGFKSRKTLALLGYLANQDKAISRSYLVNLFWPDISEARGRNNLSQALHSISTLWPGCFEASRHAVRFRRTAAHWVDAAAFNELVARGDVKSLAMAADLYQGDFMAGMYLDDCPEFEQWLRLEQESWRQRVNQVLQDLVAYHAARNELEQALQFASRLVTIDPWQEEGHRQKMLLLAQSGQRSAALAQYEICCHILAEELDAEPEPETMALYEQIRTGQLSQNAQVIVAADKRSSAVLSFPFPASLYYNNLPAQTTSFIGRETELAIIGKYLASPTCRLLTIVGLGGIGKTRLALQAAGAVGTDEFRHGVCFIPLASTSSTEYLISTIADALKFPLYGRGDPKAQLINHLNDKEMLLLMDNFEHLLSGAGLLVEILQRAPDLKILVTSRERLGLTEEWVLDLPGLSFPESEKSGQLETYGAVQLFVQRAQQVRADFWLTYMHKPAIARICRLVEGLPLGIELAATWIRTFSCQDIAAEIEKNHSFLTTSLQNISERHRSLRAVFEHSWQLLSVEEQRIFRTLSVFRGGFSRTSAEQVVGASVFSLSALVDKSLLRWTAGEQYEMHELLRQYGAEKLSEVPEEKEKAQELHAKHYASFLQEQEAQLKGEQQKEALETIRAEIDNVRAGWYWAVEHRREAEIEQYLEGLFFFHNVQSWFQAGETLFGQAAASLRKTNATKIASNGQTDKILGRVLARQGVFCASLGQYDKARAIMQEGLSIFQDPNSRQETRLSLNYLGAIAWALGEYTQAKQLCRESLMITRQIGDRWKEAWTLEYLGMIAISLGDYIEAREVAHRCLAIFSEFGYRSGIAFSLNILGIAARNLGQYTEAKQFCQESLTIARGTGDRWEEALSLEYLGLIAKSLGEYAEVKDLAQRSLAIFRALDFSRGIASSLNLLGIAACNLGEYTQAKQLHQEVLQTCKGRDYSLGIALASFYLGNVAHRSKNYIEAEYWLAESLAISKKLAYQRGITRSLNALGSVACALGKYEEAKKYLHEALKTTQETQEAPIALDILAELGRLLAEQGSPERAVELLTFVLSHPAGENETRVRAERLCAKLAAKLSDEVIETAQERGRMGKFSQVVAEVLEEETDEGLLLVC